MPKKIELKTKKTKLSVAGFIKNIEDEVMRKDCKTLVKVFKNATGMPSRMWGDTIVGFGRYVYQRSNGDEGECFATGFSPRKSGPTIYVMPGYRDYSGILAKLGPHRLGKSCLYLKNLNGIDLKVLEELIVEGLRDLKRSHETDG